MRGISWLAKKLLAFSVDLDIFHFPSGLFHLYNFSSCDARVFQVGPVVGGESTKVTSNVIYKSKYAIYTAIRWYIVAAFRSGIFIFLYDIKKTGNARIV